MEAIKVIIIDDEQHCVDALRTMLEKKFPDVAVLCGCNSVVEGKKAIEEFDPGLVFLDVEMPHSNGFELFKQFDKIDFEVIFTTAYEHYALKAIKFNALDYLLKPFSIGELEEAIGKFRERVKTRGRDNSSLDTFMYNLKTLNHSNRKMAIPTMNGLIFVCVQDILRCESVGNYTRIYFTNKTTQIVSKSLKEFEYLLDEMGFFRVHHSHLINMQQLQSYIQGEGGFALMNDGSQIEISRRRKADFLKKAARL